MSALMHHGRKSQRRNLRYRRFEHNRRLRLGDAAVDRKIGPSRVHYMLCGKTLVPTRRLIGWARWFEQASRRVGYDAITAAIDVSTVFLGIDYNALFSDGPPELFETMIFGGAFDGQTWRYATWDEARAGHLRRVAEAKAAL